MELSTGRMGSIGQSFFREAQCQDDCYFILFPVLRDHDEEQRDGPVHRFRVGFFGQSAPASAFCLNCVHDQYFRWLTHVCIAGACLIREVYNTRVY